MNETYVRRIEQGLCVQCGQPKEPERKDKRKCKACTRMDTVKSALYKRRRVEARICTQCGAKMTDEDGFYVMCRACKAKQKVTNKARYEARKAQHLCVWCTAPAAPGRIMCEKCLALRRTTAEAKHGE